MSPARLLLATATTIAAAWALAASSGVSIPWHQAGAAELRLSWSARPERIEVCRTLSVEELAALPAHMRRAVECEGRSATYDLQVTVDGAELEQMLVQGSGLRSDRPIFFLRSYRVEPGTRRIAVTLARREPADSMADTVALRPSTLARRVELDTAVTVRRGAVTLLTLEGGGFVIRQPAH